MGYMLQNDTLFPWLNILDNSLLGLKVQKKITKENKDKVISMLNTYGLKDFIYKYPSNLSGGMKQRAALIRTLAINPDILLLDEPFSALDYQTRLAVSDDVWKIDFFYQYVSVVCCLLSPATSPLLVNWRTRCRQTVFVRLRLTICQTGKSLPRKFRCGYWIS